MAGPRTEVQLIGGESLVASGEPGEVEKTLSDAARSGASRLAWRTVPATNEKIAVNPAHVISLRAARQPD